MFTQMTTNSTSHLTNSRLRSEEFMAQWHALRDNIIRFVLLVNSSKLGKEESRAWRQGGVRGQAN